MDSPLVLASVAGLALVLAVLVAVLWRDRIRARRELAQLRAEVQVLRDAPLVPRGARQDPEVAEQSFLITDAGVDRPEPNVPDRLVLSATLGEPLVKAVALAHGLARAMSPESRNRIRFEMRREVRRSRKQRRQEMKDAWRQMKADQRGQQAA